MKSLKTTIVALALVAGVTSAFAFKGLEGKAFNSKRLVQIWYYNSNSASSGSITTGSNWTLTNPGLTGCTDSTTPPLPCTLETPDNVTTTTQLDSHFASVYSDDADDIVAAAETRRQLP